MESIEVLTEKRENLYNKMEELTAKYKEIISALVKASLGDEWSCRNLYNSSLELGFIDSYWNNGTPRYQTFDVYYDVKCRDYDFDKHGYGDEYFKFQMNTCCFGSFNIGGESTQKTYYIGVGKLLSDNELQANIKMTLAEFYVKSDEIRKDARKVDNEISTIKHAEREAEEKKKEDELFEEQKKILSQIKDDETKYIVITKGATSGCNYIYRNQPVRWATTEVFDCQQNALRAIRVARMYGSSNYIPGLKFAAIEVSKLKIA